MAKQIDFSSHQTWEGLSREGVPLTFEWYADWPQLKNIITSNLSIPGKSSEDMRILVPGCGYSTLSEHLYDDCGFRKIVNIDFSKDAVRTMKERNDLARPGMGYFTMDMTNMQFSNDDIDAFDAVVDKGGFIALMDPNHGPRSANIYLTKVKRVLADGGKFICLTLAEPHALDLLFRKFRFGWKMSIYKLPPIINPDIQKIAPQYIKLHIYAVVLVKDCPKVIFNIDSEPNQALLEPPLDRERKIRAECLANSNLVYSLEDLSFYVKGNIAIMVSGRRIDLILGEPGVSKFSYNGVLLDAKEDLKFKYHYAVLIIPHSRSGHSMHTSDAAWITASSYKALRFLMVFLDSSNSICSMKDVEDDLTPLVRELAPAYFRNDEVVTFFCINEIKQRESVHKVMSELTGSIIVEDVVYETNTRYDANNGHKYRRLIFQRAEALALVQSEALLSTIGSGPSALSGEVQVVHNFLASPYHNRIISGILLISSHLSFSSSSGNLEKTVVLGLGAGLLPMFMRKILPSLEIEVVELDPLVLGVAEGFFGFKEDDRLKVHIADGIHFVKNIACSSKVDILVVDVYSSDMSTGLIFPGAGYVEDSFILAAKESLSEQGLFILNVISKSSSLKNLVYSRLKRSFSNIYRFKIEEDVNEVLFALKTDYLKDQLSEARNALAISLGWSQKVLEFSNSMECL